MYPFTAHFFGTDVYFENGAKISHAEILCEILNLKTSDLKSICRDLREAVSSVIVPDYWTTAQREGYDKKVQNAQRLFLQVDEIFAQLSLSNYVERNVSARRAMGNETDWLFLLNEYKWLWFAEDEEEYQYQFKRFRRDEEEDDNEWKPNREYNYDGEYEDVGDDDIDDVLDSRQGYRQYRTAEEIRPFVFHFFPIDYVADGQIYPAEQLLDTAALNPKIRALFQTYICFLEDILRVQLVYTRFLDEYINTERHFLTPDELAKAYIRFEKEVIQHSAAGVVYLDFTSGRATFSHSVLEDENASKILCEAYRFESLGAFLYYDFFRGLEQHYIPQRCKNCGKYFLLRGGKYSEYCEGKAPQDNKKTCRDIGARQRYHDKCKNDPVWLIYNRAYKAHYARYMKKKMTVAEFERWSAYAIELRTKAEEEKLGVEEYRALIRE